jgi:ribosomal protein S18 acetylase RimI-like enzyme
MSRTIEVRHLSAAEIHTAIDWARQEGWNPGLNDAQCFHAADSQGFLAALSAREIAAVISLVGYGPRFAFLGMYICRPDLRGQGFGMRAWRAALEQAGDRVIGLDGVPAQQENYVRSGFQLAWRNTRYRIEGGGLLPDGVVDLDTVPFAAIARYDENVFEADRQSFLRAWIAQPGAVRLSIIRNGHLSGWGLLRPCDEGFKIGPLMADDRDAAERLLDGLCAAGAGQPVFIDVPETNVEAIAMVEERGMTPCFETARMYRGNAPHIAVNRIFGITSFEVG